MADRIVRFGSYLAVVDGEGCRHVVRIGAIQSLSDSDPCHDATVIVVAGRAITVNRPLDEILAAMP